MKKLKRNLAEEEDFGRWWKILSQVKVKKTRMDWHIKGMFWERKASNSFRNEINKRTCMYLYLIISTIFFAICSVFFKDQRKKDESKFEPDTASSFQMTPELHWRAKTYSAFNFDLRTNFQHGAFAFWFHFLWKALLPPQGFRPEGEIPRRHSSNSRVYLRKVLTVEIYSHTVNIRKNLDLLEQGPRGIGR